ncbi:MAG: prohibitin family protein, partial [bacterium]|nr:prohibitin family protein [bacterium]
MLTLKYLLLGVAAAMFAAVAAKIIHDLYRRTGRDEFGGNDEATEEPFPIGWQTAGLLAAAAWIPLLAGFSIVVVPSGSAGVRISQISGTQPGTLYPGAHWIVPLIESVAVYDVRDHMFTTTAAEPPKEEKQKQDVETLRLQTKEGLLVGVAVAVRYRLDPKRLHFIHDNLPHPPGIELVPPVVASVLRQEAPNYMVRELFATKREEIRQRAAEEITQKLGADAILVKEVMLRNILLPDSYAEGLEGLLLKEQENERLAVELEVKRKLVLAAELEAEADKARQIK